MANGLWGALFSGAIAILLWVLQDRTRRRSLHSAWQAQAEELRNELRQSHQETVQFLQGQLLAKDVENARLASLLARNHGGSNDST